MQPVSFYGGVCTLIVTLLIHKKKSVENNMLNNKLYELLHTVRVNIKRLRQKLNDEKQEYIVTVFGMGYSFGE